MKKIVTKFPVSEVAKQIGVSVSTVRSLIEKGELDKTQDNPVMVNRASVIRYQARTNKFEEIEGKIKVVHTHLGQVRKILKYDAYMTSDISSLLGLASSICKSIKADEIIKYEECREYGLTPNTKGYALVTLSTLKEYLKTSRADVDKDRLLMELLSEDIKEEFPNAKVEIDEEGLLDVDLTNELQQEPIKQELAVLDQREVLGKQFKIYGTADEPLFLAKDVAEMIEHSKPRDMVQNVDLEEKVKMPFKMAASRSTQEQWFLTEDGLYEVLFQSRKPIAKQFKKQVKQILKTIRKTGGYVAPKQEERFINSYFPKLSQATKKLLISDLETKNSEFISVRDNHYKEYMKIDEEIEAIEAFIKKLKE